MPCVLKIKVNHTEPANESLSVPPAKTIWFCPVAESRKSESDRHQLILLVASESDIFMIEQRTNKTLPPVKLHMIADPLAAVIHTFREMRIERRTENSVIPENSNIFAAIS
jgi:hypothetical protein